MGEFPRRPDPRTAGGSYWCVGGRRHVGRLLLATTSELRSNHHIQWYCNTINAY
jgi:hypothetical protein